jgi:hypothetical protein
MAELPIKRVIERYNKAKTARDANRDIYEEAIELTNPFKNTWNSSMNHRQPTVQYQSQSQIAAKNFIDNLIKNYSPPYARWAELQIGPGIPEDKATFFDSILEKINDITFDYLKTSNFGASTAEMYYDLGLGTGCQDIVATNESNPLLFINNPTSTFCISTRADGFVDGRFVERKIKIGDVEAVYRGRFKFNKQLSDIEEKNPDQEIVLIEAVYYDHVNFVWYMDIIHKSSRHRGHSSVYSECPRITPRWSRISDIAMGIGPFILALADARQLNTLEQFTITSAAMSTYGVYTVAGDDALSLHNISLSPSMFIPVERNGGSSGPSIAPLPSVGNFNAQQFMLDDKRNTVKKAMLDDSLPEERRQPQSAFEFAKRIEDLQANIGASLMQLYDEHAQPLMRRVVSILQEHGAYDSIPDLPDNFASFINNFDVKINITSPVSRVQSSADVQAFLQAYGALQQISPEVAQMAVNIEKLPQYIFDKMGAPSSLLRTPEEMKQMQQQAQMQQQQESIDNATV